MKKPVYRYRATVKIRVIDGDTMVFDIDLGMRVHHHATVRIKGYNAPELRHAGGVEARGKAVAIFKSAREIVLETDKDHRSFARWVAQVWVDGVLFHRLMLEGE